MAIIHATSHDARIYVSRAGDASLTLVAASSYFDPIPLAEIASRADAYVGGRSRRSREIMDGRVRDVLFFDVALEVCEIVARSSQIEEAKQIEQCDQDA